MFDLSFLLLNPRANTWIQGADNFYGQPGTATKLIAQLAKKGPTVVCVQEDSLLSRLSRIVKTLPKNIPVLDTSQLQDHHSTLFATERMKDADFLVFLGSYWDIQFLQLLRQIETMPVIYGFGHYPIEWEPLMDQARDGVIDVRNIRWDRTVLLDPHAAANDTTLLAHLAQIHRFKPVLPEGYGLLLTPPQNLFQLAPDGTATPIICAS